MAPNTGSSFDVILGGSLQRHRLVQELILDHFEVIKLPVDLARSELQRLADEVNEQLEDALKRGARTTEGSVSAEYVAERWDSMLWRRFKDNYRVTKAEPWDFPEFQSTHTGPVSPEYLRIKEALRLEREAEARPPKSPGFTFLGPRPAPVAPQTEGQDELESIFKGLGKLDLSEPYHGSEFSSPSDPFATSKMPSPELPEPELPEPELPSPELQPLPEPAALSLDPSMSVDDQRSAYSSVATDNTNAMKDWHSKALKSVDATAQDAGISTTEYLAKKNPIRERFTLETEEDRRSDWEKRAAAKKAADKSPSEPAKKEPVAQPQAKPAKKDSVPKPSKKSWADIVDEELDGQNPAQVLMAPAAPKPPPKSSTAPKGKVADVPKPASKENQVVRPVREDLDEARRNRVLPLKLRQELWEENFAGCRLQDGAEPLQLQFPRGRRNSLLWGDIKTDAEGVTTRSVFDQLRRFLGPVVDLIWQDSPDGRFNLTLLYIGLRQSFKDTPRDYVQVEALAVAWECLSQWAQLVSQGWCVDAATFAEWHANERIERIRKGIMGNDIAMTDAISFLKSKNIPLQPLSDEPREQQVPRPKQSQHQKKVTAECRAREAEWAAMALESQQREREAIFSRVAVIIDQCRVEPGEDDFDWKNIQKALMMLINDGDASRRSKYAYEACTSWSNTHLSNSAEALGDFQRKLTSWWNNYIHWTQGRSS